MLRVLLVLIPLVLSACGHTVPARDDMERLLAERSLSDQDNAPDAQVAPPDVDATHGSRVVVTAMGYLGVPYKRGGNSAETGFDCSGFVRAIYADVSGLTLPRRADAQAAATQKIDRSELQPGDLVFFNTLRRAYSHVGIYVGEGKFIHSPRSGAHVRVEDMRINYWNTRFNGARRVPAPAGVVQAAAP